MFSFVHESNVHTPPIDSSNPELSQVPKQRQTPLKIEEMSDSGNEIQTPNFHFFHNHFGNQNLFDAYHNQFSHKSSQVNKLISTFEDLGLDIEYLQESDAENELHSIAESLNEQDELKKTCSIQEKIDRERLPEKAVSGLHPAKSLESHRRGLREVRKNCQILRKQLQTVTQTHTKFQAQCKDFISNAFASFKVNFSDFLKAFQSLIKTNESTRASNIYRESFRKENDELQGLFAVKQQKIRKLIKDNEYLTLENQKLYGELSLINKKHQQCKEVNEDYESMVKYQRQNQKKICELQQENSELAEKVDSLQWNLKQTQRQLSNANLEERNLKNELERKYEKVFEQTTEKLVKRIEAETYYKLKNQYPFNFDQKESKFKESLNFQQQHSRPPYERPINRSSSSFGSSIRNQPFRTKDLITFRQTNMTESLPSPKMCFSQANLRSEFAGFDSYSYDSGYSGKSIESKEREAERILNEIKMMKTSKIMTSSASSKIIENNRRQSFTRLNHLKV